MNNGKSIILASIWILLALILTVFLVGRIRNGSNSWNLFRNGLVFSSSSDFDDNKSTVYKTETFDADGISNIEVDLVSERIRIIPYNESKIKVELKGATWEDSKVTMGTKGNTLEVKVPAMKGKRAKIGSRAAVIYIPESLAKSGSLNASLTSVSGAVYADDIVFERLSVNTVSGSQNINGCTLNKANLESVSGSINTYSNAKEIKINSVSGSVHAEANYGRVNAETVSGSIHLKSHEQLSADSEFDSVSGSIHVDLPADSNFEFKYESMSGSINCNFIDGRFKKSGSQTIGNGGIRIKCETMSGSIHVNQL